MKINVYFLKAIDEEFDGKLALRTQILTEQMY